MLQDIRSASIEVPDAKNINYTFEFSKVVLIGFMRAGKSTVGPILAERLGFTLVDTDVLAVTLAGRKSVKEIFSIDGEKLFRTLEKTIAKEIGGNNGIVISTGGGMALHGENMKALSSDGGRVIYLQASFETLCLRSNSAGANRPLFENESSARQLFQAREQLYSKAADYAVAVDTISPCEIAESILKYLQGSDIQ